MSSGHKSYAFNKPAALKKLARILEMLAVPTTVYRVAEALPLCKRTTTAYLAYLRGIPSENNPTPPRRIRIAGWEMSDTGHYMALYQVGSRPDEPHPPARTTTQRRRDIRKRLRQTDPDELLRRREIRQAKRRKPRRDPMIAALFGATAA